MSLQGFKIENSIIKYDYEALQNKPTVDDTLSVQGALADAKATGDAIQQIEDNVNEAIQDIGNEVLTSLAPEYSNAATYAVGDYVVYNGQLFRCNTAIETAEEWTPAKWTAAQLAPDVADLKADLDDLVDNNLDLVEVATAGATNAYKQLENKLLVNVVYTFKVTSRTTGTYLFQAGIGQSASSMYDVGTYHIDAGETKVITGYTTDNAHIKYFRLYSADVPLENMDWDVSVYTYYNAHEEVDNVSEKIDIEINDVKEEIGATWRSVLLETVPVSDSPTSNWYKLTENALENIEYDFVITSQTAGTYSFQIGNGGSASGMTLTVGEFTFTAGETKTITYTPIGSNLKYFRFYSASVPVGNTIWTLAIQRLITAEKIKNTQNNVDEINTLIGCEYLPTVKGEWYNTSGSTVDITAPNSNRGWNSAVVPCSENDAFTITGTGGSAPRLWAFVASDGTIISHQDSAVNPSTVTNYILYAPENSAYFIVNFENASPFRLLKGLTLDYKFGLIDYENRITTKHKIIVDANGSGDYTSIQDAINAITDSSFTNQYEIVLLGGTYSEQNLTLPAYTYLHGVGLSKPIITSVGLSEYVSVIDAQNTCRIANVKVVSGTKYCLHEDVKLNDCTVICENVDFEQTGTMNTTIIGDGAFENAKFVFVGCTFKGGQVFSHTNSNSFIGVTQKFSVKYCKFEDAGIVLSSSGNAESNAMAECICEVIGCRGDETYPLITCRVQSEYATVYPWKVIGGGNVNFAAAFDGVTLAGVVNTTDTD